MLIFFFFFFFTWDWSKHEHNARLVIFFPELCDKFSSRGIQVTDSTHVQHQPLNFLEGEKWKKS